VTPPGETGPRFDWAGPSLGPGQTRAAVDMAYQWARWGEVTDATNIANSTGANPSNAYPPNPTRLTLLRTVLSTLRVSGEDKSVGKRSNQTPPSPNAQFSARPPQIDVNLLQRPIADTNYSATARAVNATIKMTVGTSFFGQSVPDQTKTILASMGVTNASDLDFLEQQANAEDDYEVLSNAAQSIGSC